MSHKTEAVKLEIYYQHVDGLRIKSRQEKILKSIRDTDYDLIILTGTHLTLDIDSRSMFDNDFEVIRKDKNDKNGGFLIAYKREFNILINTDLSSKSHEVEEIWISLNFESNQNLQICIADLKENCKKENFQQFFEQMKRNCENRSDKFLIIGNFNYDDFNKFKSGSIKIRKQGSKLDIINKCTKGLKQVNKIQNCDDDEMLDMVFTNITKTTAERSNLELVKIHEKHPALKIKVNMQQQPQVHESNRNLKLEAEIDKLKKSFETFKVAHDEEIKALKSEIRVLRGILEDEGIL